MARRFTIEVINGFGKVVLVQTQAKAIYGNENQYQFFRKRSYEESLVPEPFSRTRECQAYQNLGKPRNFRSSAVEDAMGWLLPTGKLNSIQTRNFRT